jgi:hypothetical protein
MGHERFDHASAHSAGTDYAYLYRHFSSFPNLLCRAFPSGLHARPAERPVYILQKFAIAHIRATSFGVKTESGRPCHIL